jgi:Zn-dependent protease
MLLFRLQDPQTIIIFFIVISLAFAYHEFAHAIVADRLGDPTPRQYGRITLNPLPHLSLAGLVMLFLIGFGGAYTPVRPDMLRRVWGNQRISHALVAVAGPLANLFMATLFALPLRFYLDGTLEMNGVLVEFMRWGVRLNLFLMLFNLMPIPPLDGFTILQGVLPPQMARTLDPLRQYGLIILLAVLLLLPRIGLDLFGGLVVPTMIALERFLLLS